MSARTYTCRANSCAYKGPMPERECPECGTTLPGPTPGTKFAPREKGAGVETTRVALRLGPMGTETHVRLAEASGLDDSKLFRLALACLDKHAKGEGKRLIKSLELTDDALTMALDQR